MCSKRTGVKNRWCANGIPSTFPLRIALDGALWAFGDGRLVDDLGTSTGSRQMQLYNGRAEIGVRLARGTSVVSVLSNGMATQFLRLVAG